MAHTDADGYFEIAGVWKTAPVDILHQPVIEEKVFVGYKGTNYTVLDLTKMDYAKLGELPGVPGDSDHDKNRLIAQDGILYFKFDLEMEKVPIGRWRNR